MDEIHPELLKKEMRALGVSHNTLDTLMYSENSEISELAEQVYILTEAVVKLKREVDDLKFRTGLGMF